MLHTNELTDDIHKEIPAAKMWLSHIHLERSWHIVGQTQLKDKNCECLHYFKNEDLETAFVWRLENIYIRPMWI